MLARLRPPNGLRARICWIMLVISLWVIAATLPQLTFGSAPLGQRLIAIAGLVLLAASQIRGYRRGGFPIGEQILEGLVLAVAASSVDDLRSAMGLFFVPM